MNVLAIFQKHYDGELSGAVWIINTVSNKVRFEEEGIGLDPNSALFSIDNYDTLQSALLEIVWGIHDHYPDLENISVIGVDLDLPITKGLQDDYDIEPTSNGFVCRPTKGN